MSFFVRLEGGPFDGDNANVQQLPDVIWANHCPHQTPCHPSRIDWHPIAPEDEPVARDLGYQPYHRDRGDAHATVYVWANLQLRDDVRELAEAAA